MGDANQGEIVTQQERELTARLHSGCLWEEIMRALSELDNERKPGRVVVNFRVKRDFRSSEQAVNKIGWFQTLTSLFKNNPEARKPKETPKSTVTDDEIRTESGVCDEVEVVGKRVAVHDRREGACLEVPPHLSKANYSPLVKREVHHYDAEEKYTNDELALMYHRDEMQKEPTIVHNMTLIDSPNSSLNLIEALIKKKSDERVHGRRKKRDLGHGDCEDGGKGEGRLRYRRRDRHHDTIPDSVRDRGKYNLRKASSGSVPDSTKDTKRRHTDRPRKDQTKRHKHDLQKKASSSSIGHWKKGKTGSSSTQGNTKRFRNYSRSSVKESRPSVKRVESNSEELKIRVKRGEVKTRKQSAPTTESEVMSRKENEEEPKKVSKRFLKDIEKKPERQSKHDRRRIKDHESSQHRRNRHKESDDPEGSSSLKMSEEKWSTGEKTAEVCDVEVPKVKEEKKESEKFVELSSSDEHLAPRIKRDKKKAKREESYSGHSKNKENKLKQKSSENSSLRESFAGEASTKRAGKTVLRKKRIHDKSSQSSVAVHSVRKITRNKSYWQEKVRPKLQEKVKLKNKRCESDSFSSTDFEVGCEDQHPRETSKNIPIYKTPSLENGSKDNVKAQKTKHVGNDVDLITAVPLAEKLDEKCAQNHKERKMEDQDQSLHSNPRNTIKQINDNEDSKSFTEVSTDRGSEKPIKLIESIKLNGVGGPSLSSRLVKVDCKKKCSADIEPKNRTGSNRLLASSDTLSSKEDDEIIKRDRMTPQCKRYEGKQTIPESSGVAIDHKKSSVVVSGRMSSSDRKKKLDNHVPHVSQNKETDAKRMQRKCNSGQSVFNSRKKEIQKGLESEAKVKSAVPSQNHSKAELKGHEIECRAKKSREKSPLRKVSREKLSREKSPLRKVSREKQSREKSPLRKVSREKQSREKSPLRKVSREKQSREKSPLRKVSREKQSREKSPLRKVSREKRKETSGESISGKSRHMKLEEDQRNDKRRAEGKKGLRRAEKLKLRRGSGENVFRVEASTHIDKVSEGSSSAESVVHSESWSDASWECQCGCTVWKGIPAQQRPSSSSSFEQLRSYSGNLTMPSEYKKGILSNVKCVPNRIT